MKKTLTLERVIEHLRLFICSVAAVWGFWITFRVGNTQDTEMLLLLVEVVKENSRLAVDEPWIFKFPHTADDVISNVLLSGAAAVAVVL